MIASGTGDDGDSGPATLSAGSTLPVYLWILLVALIGAYSNLQVQRDGARLHAVALRRHR